MELRNQLMHNIAARSYESCFSFMQGKDTFLLKRYPQDTTFAKEIQLKNAVVSLSDEVLNKTYEVLEKVKQKLKKQVEFEIAKEIKVALFSFLREAPDAMNKYFKEEIAKSPTYDADRLRATAFYILESLKNHLIKEVKSP
jgi:hypothetical protein